MERELRWQREKSKYRKKKIREGNGDNKQRNKHRKEKY